jgi:hypothetical protein
MLRPELKRDSPRKVYRSFGNFYTRLRCAVMQLAHPRPPDRIADWHANCSFLSSAAVMQRNAFVRWHCRLHAAQSPM